MVSDAVLEESQHAMESGIVTFLYRPKVDMEEVSKLQDVQRFYMILEPTQQQQQYKTELDAAAKEKMQQGDAPTANKPEAGKDAGADQLQSQGRDTDQHRDQGPATRSRKRKQQQDQQPADRHTPASTSSQTKLDKFATSSPASQQLPDSQQEAAPPVPAQGDAARGASGSSRGKEGDKKEDNKEDKMEEGEQQPAEQPKARLLVVPKKRLPDGAKHERFYAFVEAVGDSTHDLAAGLTASSYDTKTRGHREQGAARVVGEGSYMLTQQGPRGASQLVYKVCVPPQPGAAQATFKLGAGGSFLIKAKNPERRGPGAPSLGADPAYSEPQRKKFRGASWTDADPSLLSTTAAELLLIGTRDEPSGESEEVLEEVYLSDADTEQGAGRKDQGDLTALADHLRQHVEPEGQDGKGPEALPVTPAITGEMV